MAIPSESGLIRYNENVIPIMLALRRERVEREATDKSNAPRTPQPRPPAHRVLSLVLDSKDASRM
jgi:hypothetical protein